MPPKIVRKIGWEHDRGPRTNELKYDLPVLAHFGALWKRSRGDESELKYHDGESIEVGEDQMVVSIDSIARVLWRELFFRPVPKNRLDDRDYGRFYDNVRASTRRIMSVRVEKIPLLRRIDAARPDKNGKAKDLFGQVWSMDGNYLDQMLPRLGVTTAAPLLVADASYMDTSYVGSTSILSNAVHEFQRRLVAEEGVGSHLVEAAGIVGPGFERRRQPVNYLKWLQGAHRSNKPRHISVGTWCTGVVETQQIHDYACAVPFLVLDIDGDTRDNSYACTLRILDHLEDLGVPLDLVVVSFTGGRGFHIRLPHALIGSPIYRTPTTARTIITGFFERLLEDVCAGGRRVLEVIDPNAFNPKQLIRVLGARHEDRPEYHCVGFSGAEIAGTADYGAYPLSGILEHSLRRTRYSIPNPNDGRPSSKLRRFIDLALNDLEDRTQFVDRIDRGVIERIKRGIAEGEQFSADHVGRNKAALLYACYLLNNEGRTTTEARAVLQIWNAQSNQPPLPEQELMNVLRNAERFLGRIASRAREA